MKKIYTILVLFYSIFNAVNTSGQVYMVDSTGQYQKKTPANNTGTVSKSSTPTSASAATAAAATVAAGQDPTNLFPPSPTAAALARYGDIPVSYHTGMPNISIPIYEVKSKELSLPISLSYHASGIKVADVASWVGLGWSLNAGGVITRTVQSLPDEGASSSGNGYLTNNTSLYTFARACDVPPYKQYKLPRSVTYNHPGSTGVCPTCTGPTCPILACCNGVWTTPSAAHDLNQTNYSYFAEGGSIDMEPDIFFFNVGGFSGKFIFDSLGVAHMFPEQDTKVSYTIPNGSGKFTQFVLTVPDGTQYFFGSTHGDTNPAFLQGAIAYETTASQSTNAVGSSWFLTKIVSANGLSKIFLSYTAEEYATYELKNQYLSSPSFSFNSIPFPGYDIEKTSIKGVRLSNIYTSDNNSQVAFVATDMRQDVSNLIESDITPTTVDAKVLNQIQIKSGTGTNVGFKKFIFNYDYFVANSFNSNFPELAGSPTSFTKDNKRLKLLSVREQSDDGTVLLPAHQFEYNSTITIPRRLSFGRDHWGFYNGKEGLNRSLIHLENLDGVSTGAPVITSAYPFRPANRSTDADYLAFASLNKIIYPTGGYTTFDFESHRFSSLPIGGLRIKAIKNYESNGTLLTQKNFNYLNTGKLFSRPTYFFTAKLNTAVYNAFKSAVSSAPPFIGPGSDVKDIVSSSPVLPLNTTQGNHIGYTTVIVSETGNGSMTYTYNTDLTPYPVTSFFSGEYDYFGVKRLFNYPKDPVKENYKRGQLEKEEAKNEAGVLLSETIYNYTVDERPVIIPAIKIDANNVNGYPAVKMYNHYAFFTGRSDVTSKTTKICDVNGANCITRTSSFAYDSPKHFQMTSSVEEASNSEVLVTKMKYAQDYVYTGTPTGTGGSSLFALNTKNMVVPVETNINRKTSTGTNERVISGEINYFDPTVLKPSHKYIMETINPIAVGSFITSNVGGVAFNRDTRYPANAAQNTTFYTISGNVKEIYVREGTSQVSTYLWGYNNAYPIAEIKNATYSAVVTALGQTVIDNLANSNNMTDAAIRTALAPVQNIANALATIYTYNPLLGVTSTTSPNGIINYYEYDKLGRLLSIKDNNQKVVKSYQYSYKNQ